MIINKSAQTTVPKIIYILLSLLFLIFHITINCYNLTKNITCIVTIISIGENKGVSIRVSSVFIDGSGVLIGEFVNEDIGEDFGITVC